MVSTSQPLAAIPSQFAKPVVHVPSVQTLPAPHDAPALANAQARLQAPQFAAVLIGVSQPSVATPLQSAKPAAHTMPQPPLVQNGVAFVPVGHAFPQVVQLVASLCRLRQVEAAPVPQIVRPAPHDA